MPYFTNFSVGRSFYQRIVHQLEWRGKDAWAVSTVFETRPYRLADDCVASADTMFSEMLQTSVASTDAISHPIPTSAVYFTAASLPTR